MIEVLVFSTHASLDNRISKHLQTITDSGYRVLYVNTYDDSNNVCMDNVEHRNLKQSFSKHNIKGVIKAALEMRRITKAEHDAVVCHIHDPLLLFISSIAKQNGVKVVYDRHESYDLAGGISGRACHLMEVLYRRNIDAVVYVNDVQGKYLERKGYKIIVKIPNYQSKRVFEYAKHERTYPKETEQIVIVYFGVINNSSRDCGLMLDAMNDILLRSDNIVFEMGGVIQGTELRDRIMEMQRSFKNFKYFGVMKYSDVVERTVNADIGIYLQKLVPNNIGSSPNKIYEYLMAGLAICAQGRFEDWERIEGNAGVVLPYGSSKETVITAIEKLTKRNNLAYYKEQSSIIADAYTWESIEHRYSDLYEQLITSN